MPGYSTVLLWRSSNREFAALYAKAREDQADVYADQILDIADQAVRREVDVHCARLAIDARKWVASKLKPRAYGDRVGVEYSGALTATVTRPLERAPEPQHVAGRFGTHVRPDLAPQPIGPHANAALARLAQAHLPYISVLTDPTTGGVSASLAMLGDLNVAEPKALIGFAGPRVIEQTVREVLPPGFQRSEFLLSHGAIDQIVDRRQMREHVARLLGLLQGRAAAA